MSQILAQAQLPSKTICIHGYITFISTIPEQLPKSRNKIMLVIGGEGGVFKLTTNDQWRVLQPSDVHLYDLYFKNPLYSSV